MKVEILNKQSRNKIFTKLIKFNKINNKIVTATYLKFKAKRSKLT